MSEDFKTITYTGTGQDHQVFTGFEPNMTIIKSDSGWSWDNSSYIDPFNDSLKLHKDEVRAYLKDKYPEEFI